jgi:hypothetical protein
MNVRDHADRQWLSHDAFRGDGLGDDGWLLLPSFSAPTSLQELVARTGLGPWGERVVIDALLEFDLVEISNGLASRATDLRERLDDAARFLGTAGRCPRSQPAPRRASGLASARRYECPRRSGSMNEAAVASFIQGFAIKVEEGDFRAAEDWAEAAFRVRDSGLSRVPDDGSGGRRDPREDARSKARRLLTEGRRTWFIGEAG